MMAHQLHEAPVEGPLLPHEHGIDCGLHVVVEPTFADAILDRLVHNAYRLALDGPPMRDPKTSKIETVTPIVDADGGAAATAMKPAKAAKA
jgi:hypothetical protein